MPLYQGRLCDILPLEISAIEEILLQLFDGVSYMHGRRVLHKDIKPENILVKRKSPPWQLSVREGRKMERAEVIVSASSRIVPWS